MQISGKNTLEYKEKLSIVFLEELHILTKHSKKYICIKFLFPEGAFVLENEVLM